MSGSKKIIGFIALAIAMFMGTLDSTIVNIALPDITNYFNADLNDTSWISTIYVLGLAVFMITASKLADQFGRKKVMLLGLVLFGTSSALCGLSQSLMFLVVMRFLQGIGGAIITPIVIPMALELFGRENTQKIAGIIGAVTALAAASGPPVGGLLIEYLNWKAIFFINVPFAVISILLTTWVIKESYDATTSRSIDWIGMTTLTITLFLLTFALLKGNDYGWSSVLIVSMFIGSGIFSVLFVVAELKVRAPMVELRLFRERTFSASVICYLISGFGIASPLLIFNFFLQSAVGYDVQEASFIVMVISLTGVITMPLGSVIASKFGASPVNFLGLLGMAFGVFLLSRLTVSSSKALMIADMVACGFGMGFSCQSLVSSIKHLPTEKSGIGSGIVNAARQVGTCIGIALLVTVLDIHVTDAKDAIQDDAIKRIEADQLISPEIRNVMVKDIRENLSTNQSTDSAQTSNSLQEALQDDVKNELDTVATIPKPQDNEALEALYDGTSSLTDGLDQLHDKEDSLHSGIISLNSGLVALADGSDTLKKGMTELNQGINQADSGAKEIEAGMNKTKELHTGTAELENGTKSLSEGTQALLDQFEEGSPSNQTLKDGVKQLNQAAQAVAGQLSEGSTANLRYMVESLNADRGVQGYVGTSDAVIKALRNTSDSAVYSAVLNQMLGTTSLANQKALATTLVLITNTNDSKADVVVSAPTGSISMTQSQATILLLGKSGYGSIDAIKKAQADYETGGEIIVTSINRLDQQFTTGTDGPTLYDAITKIAGGTAELESQMSPGPSNGKATLYDRIAQLNQGAQQLYHGAAKLNIGTEKLKQLQQGMDELTKALSKLSDGSAALQAGADNLNQGIIAAGNGSVKLAEGSGKLVEATGKAGDGAEALLTGIGKAGQKDQIEQVIDRLKADKDDQIAGAFSKTFLLAAIILTVLSVVGLFTDRRMSQEKECTKDIPVMKPESMHT